MLPILREDASSKFLLLVMLLNGQVQESFYILFHIKRKAANRFAILQLQALQTCTIKEV